MLNIYTKVQCILCVCVYKNIHTHLPLYVYSNKTTLVNNEVATFRNSIVKISKPSFRSSAWPFYQEYEDKWALTTSTSPRNRILFSADIKPVQTLLKNQWDYSSVHQLKWCLLMLFWLIQLYITWPSCLSAVSLWVSVSAGKPSKIKYYWPPRQFIQQLRAAYNNRYRLHLYRAVPYWHVLQVLQCLALGYLPCSAEFSVRLLGTGGQMAASK